MVKMKKLKQREGDRELAQGPLFISDGAQQPSCFLHDFIVSMACTRAVEFSGECGLWSQTWGLCPSPTPDCTVLRKLSVNYHSFLLLPLCYSIAAGHKLFSLSGQVCQRVDSYHSGAPVSTEEISLPFVNRSEEPGQDLPADREDSRLAER